MKPEKHSRISARKFGGEASEYQHIHEWFDQTKAHHADMRHRSILHSSFGIYLCAQVFGDQFVNSIGRTVSVRDVGEQHVIDDLGRIPSLTQYLNNMTLQPWMGGNPAKVQYKIMRRGLLNSFNEVGVKTQDEALSWLDLNSGSLHFGGGKMIVSAYVNGERKSFCGDSIKDLVNELIDSARYTF